MGRVLLVAVVFFAAVAGAIWWWPRPAPHPAAKPATGLVAQLYGKDYVTRENALGLLQSQASQGSTTAASTLSRWYLLAEGTVSPHNLNPPPLNAHDAQNAFKYARRASGLGVMGPLLDVLVSWNVPALGTPSDLAAVATAAQGGNKKAAGVLRNVCTDPRYKTMCLKNGFNTP